MLKHENGSVMVFMAGIILTLTGFAILAIDVGRIYIIRTEMQNVADSSALAGANCLTRQTLPGSTSDCSSITSATLNWNIAQAKANYQLGRNTADNVAISTTDAGHQITTGYWNLLSGGPSGGTLDNTFAPLTVNDKPAVRVVVTKDTGKNNGPITMLTKIIFGGSNVPMTASAVAVVSSPGNVLPGNLIPLAIDKCMFDLYWDSTTNSPKLAPSNTPLMGVPQTQGQPFEFRIGSAYHYPNCEAGQWTSFGSGTNSASVVRNLINSGNPTALGVNDQTFIQNGTENALYKALDDKYPTPPGADVTVTVVDKLTMGQYSPIVAFAGFKITDVRGQNLKYIQGHFVKGITTSGSGGIGPFYGAYTPPRLAQ